MNPAQKALWYIESHLAEALTLDEISAIGGVSRFHMVRAFAAATGFSVMRYVRARRLSNAARALASGAPDILSLALDADYSSHEAFTRAFRDHFGATPESVRAGTCLDHLKLQEPILMISTALDHLKPPRFETGKALLVAGLGERINAENGAGIPSQWQRFHQIIENVPSRIGKVSYGIYVYHLPILLLGQWCFLRFGFHWNEVSRALFFLVYLAVVLAVAEASFRWLEAPFLRLKDLWKRGAQPDVASLIGRSPSA